MAGWPAARQVCLPGTTAFQPEVLSPALVRAIRKSPGYRAAAMQSWHRGYCGPRMPNTFCGCGDRNDFRASKSGAG